MASAVVFCSAVGRTAAVLDLGQREHAVARSGIVGVGVLIGDAVDQRGDVGRAHPAALLRLTVAVPATMLTV